jgi:spermidine synthase
MIINPEIMITKNLHPEDINLLEELERSERVIHKEKTSFNGTVTVVENEIGRFLKFDNSYQAGIINHPYYKGNVPYVNYFFLAAAMKKEVKNVLILGLGAGTLVNQLQSLLPQAEKFDVVEINPEVVAIAQKYFGFRNRGVGVYVQDARVFARKCKEKYDLVILDIFSEAGIAYRIMTKEFLEELSNIMTDDAILASNAFGITDLKSEDNIIFKSVYKTYTSVFKDNLIFPANYGNYEFYKQVVGVQHELSNLTNIILFSSKDYIDLKTSKVLKLGDKLKLNLDLYVQDFYTDELNLDNTYVFLDKYEHIIKDIKSFLKK